MLSIEGSACGPSSFACRSCGVIVGFFGGQTKRWGAADEGCSCPGSGLSPGSNRTSGLIGASVPESLDLRIALVADGGADFPSGAMFNERTDFNLGQAGRGG